MKLSIVTPWIDHPELITGYERTARGAETIIVDNGSSDAGPIRAMVDRLGGKLIENGHNAGFGLACNQGLAEATGDVVLMLNNDVLPLGNLSAAVLQQVRDGALYGNELNFQRLHGLLIPYLSGWCIAATRATWDRLCGFHAEQYPGCYWEDNDLAWRAIYEAGMKLVRTAWPVRHLGNTTSKGLPGAYASSEPNKRTFSRMVGGFLKGAAA